MMIVIQSMYFFLPAFFANMAPEFVKKIPLLNYPVWEREFGTNKTWRGLVVASLMGVLIFSLQKYLFKFGFFYNLSIIDYADFSLIFGFLLGFGAILGDLVKSYFKRKYGFKPGQSWKPWDQLDFVIGALVLSWLMFVPGIEVVVTLLVVSPFLHMLICYIGYSLGIKKNKF